MPDGSRTRVLAPAGETGRMLGATHAVRFAFPDSWSWSPDLGRLVPPRPGPSVSLEALDRELRELRDFAVLIGPVPPGDRELGEEIAARVIEAGGAVAVVHAGDAPSGTRNPRRIDLVDGFAAEIPPGTEIGIVRPRIAGWSDLFGSSELDFPVPLASTGEEAREIVRWAEETRRADADALVSTLFHGEKRAPETSNSAPPVRPLEWPFGVPTLAAWVGARVRAAAWNLTLGVDESEAAELHAAARKLDQLVPSLDRIVEAGLVGQIPGLGERGSAAVREAIESGRRQSAPSSRQASAPSK